MSGAGEQSLVPLTYSQKSMSIISHLETISRIETKTMPRLDSCCEVITVDTCDQ